MSIDLQVTADIDEVLAHKSEHGGMAGVAEACTRFRACIERHALAGSAYRRDAEAVQPVDGRKYNREDVRLRGILSALRQDLVRSDTKVTAPTAPSDEETTWLTSLALPSDPVSSRTGLLAALEKGFSLGRECRVLVLVARHTSAEPWRAVFGRLDLVRPGGPPATPIRPRGNVYVIEERPAAPDLLTRLSTALGGGDLAVGGVALSDHGMNSGWDLRRHHDHGIDYGTGWPSVLLAPADGVKNRPFIDGAIEAEGPVPVFMGLDRLAWAVSGFRPGDSPPTDVRPRRFQVLLWDYRGRVDRFRSSGRTLYISVAPRNDPALRLVAVAEGAAEQVPLLKDAPGEETIVLPEQVLRARVTLRQGDDVIVEHALDLPRDATHAELLGHAPRSTQFGALPPTADGTSAESTTPPRVASETGTESPDPPRSRVMNTTELLAAFLRGLYAASQTKPGGYWYAYSIGDDVGMADRGRLDEAVLALSRDGLVSLTGWEPNRGHGVAITVDGSRLVEERQAADKLSAAAGARKRAAGSATGNPATEPKAPDNSLHSTLAKYLPSELTTRLDILQDLGTGSFATAFQVVDRESLQRFALKVVRATPEARTRAIRERDAAQKLRHENILETIECHPDGEWFLLPLAEGTLGQLLSWGRLGREAAQDVAWSVGLALAHAHAAGYLHRDLHPENVLRHDGRWKVADWGLTVARDHRRLTRTKSLGGNQVWTAPEQLRSLKDADARSDLFSLGRLVEWLASGKLPEPDRPGTLPTDHALAAFVNATTRLDPDERPGSIEAAFRLLGAWPASPGAVAPLAPSSMLAGHPLAHADDPQQAPRPGSGIQLTIDFKSKRLTQEHHDYELVTCLKNVGTKRLDDWEMEIEFPTPLLDGAIHGIKVGDRSNEIATLFRVDARTTQKQLRPGDEQCVRLGYFINNDIFWKRKDLFESTAKARALIDGELVARVERTIRELQNF